MKYSSLEMDVYAVLQGKSDYNRVFVFTFALEANLSEFCIHYALIPLNTTTLSLKAQD